VQAATLRADARLCCASAWLHPLAAADLNLLLLRQVVEVIHPGLAGVSKKDLKEKLTSMYKVRATAHLGLLRGCWGL
jgi:hypothetical protein